MINSNLFLGYDPKCSLYKREQIRGKVNWYVSYYLPNGKRVQRPVHQSFKKAKNLMRIKELQLLQGIFDAKDLAKLDGFLPEYEEPERLTIEKALELYFEVSESRKSPKTQYIDSSSIKQCFGFFTDGGKIFMDEITALDAHRLIRSLDKAGKSESTIKRAVTMVKKVFNLLIDEIRVFEGENPVPKKLKLPKKGGLVRNRLPSDQEIMALLTAPNPKVTSSSSVSPVREIVGFLIATGARVSEVLHAEWGDFDLEAGTWHVRNKPQCPTQFGLGWAPKWHKERVVLLFPQTLAILNSMPIVNSFGSVPVRNEQRVIVERKMVPAQFVFPKKEVKILGEGSKHVTYTRTDSIKRSWQSLKERAGVTDLQLKDLRTYFNHKLKSMYGFSSKEAGWYIGNSKEVNDLHYSPVSLEIIQAKMNQFEKANQAVALESQVLMNQRCY